MKRSPYSRWTVVGVMAAGMGVPSWANDPKPPAVAGDGVFKESFEAMAAGELPAALMKIEGEWAIVEAAGNKVLEVQAEPVVDAAVLIGPSLKEGATVQARVKADKSGRAFPRLGVGLYGISGVKLRLVPAQKKIELVQGDAVVAEGWIDWKPNVWWHVELRVVRTGETWSAHARLWAEGEPRPGEAQLKADLSQPPGQGRASLLASPYANKPVAFDDVVVTRGN